MNKHRLCGDLGENMVSTIALYVSGEFVSAKVLSHDMYDTDVIAPLS